MGEPLANYEAVRAAVRLMTDSRVFGLSKRHVTISTVGVVPRIKQLATDLPVSQALTAIPCMVPTYCCTLYECHANLVLQLQ